MSTFTPKQFGNINAMANITSQTNIQRSNFKTTFKGLGVYENQFNIWVDLNVGNTINQQAFNKMIELHEQGKYIASGNYLNPDFSSELELGYDSTPKLENIKTSTSGTEDKTNILGPNLKSGSFNENGLPEYDPRREQNFDFDQMKSKLGTRGFGNYFDQNKLDNATFGSYLRRSGHASYVGSNIDDNQRPALGEYIEKSDLDY